MQVIPVGFGFHPYPSYRHQVTVDAEQPLDEALRSFVPSFAEVLVADDAVPIDEVERRPIAVGERAPDLVVIVGRDGVADGSVPRRLLDAVEIVLEGELGGVYSNDDQPVVAVGPRPGADVWLLAEPVDARERPEVHENDPSL